MGLQMNVTRTRTASRDGRIVYPVMKRLTDIVVSFTLLLLLLPLFIFISRKLYKNEGKPIFSHEYRLGKNNRPFLMYTFRTMTNPSRVINKLPLHPYNDYEFLDKFHRTEDNLVTLTSTGIWLKKYKLHKIPMLWNVLKGNMSLVGPEAERLNNNGEKKLSLTVKPGITGYAQMKPNPFKNPKIKLHDDLYYIKNRSYLLDLKIMFHRFIKVK